VTELPTGWTSATIGELAATSLGKMLDAKQQTGAHPTPYLRNINVRWGGFDLADIAEMDVPPHELDRVLAVEGDVIACEGGEPGRAAVWRGSPIAIQKALHRIRPAEGVSPHYLALALREKASTRELDRLFTGTTIKHLPQEKLRQVTLPIAPTAQQARIVAAIEETFSKLDAGEAGLRTVRQLLKRMRDAVLAAAVTGHLVPQDPTDTPATKLVADLSVDEAEPANAPPLPREWAWVQLGDLAREVRNGIFVSRPAGAPPGVPILRIGAVRPMALDLTDVRYAPLDPSDSAVARATLAAGDLLFVRYNGNPAFVGACAVVPETSNRLLHPDKLIRVRLSQQAAVPTFVAMAASSGASRRFIDRATKTTAGQAGISGADLKLVPIPLPPPEEQHRIVAEIERRFSFIDRCERAVTAILERASALRRAVLKAAFEGRLVPQDPTDEPAAVLLERIRAEHASAPKVRKRRSTPKVRSIS
jgi:type I restriction enzyme S subunit